MGHLVRQLSILRWIKRLAAVLEQPLECWVLTSSEADTLARRESIPALKMPSKAMLRDAGIEPTRYLRIARGWTMNTLIGLAPDILIVDTFPGGSYGELISTLELARHRVLVARRVRAEFAEEDTYQALLPLYHQIIRPDEEGVGPILIRNREELLDKERARQALGIPENMKAVYVSLGGGGDIRAAELLPKMVRALRSKEYFVVVAAGPLYQGEEVRGDGITWLSRYVTLEVLKGVDVAISAGGYNSFHELMYAGVPTVFLPQPRIADDQKERVERAVAVGAGKLARDWQEAVELVDDCGSAEAAQQLVSKNGAKQAAVAILSQILPEQDVELAARVLEGKVLQFLNLPGESQQALSLIQIFSGGNPQQKRQRIQLLESLQAKGQTISPTPERYQPEQRILMGFDIILKEKIPLDIALNLCQSLQRKFPLAEADDVLDAMQILFPCWGQFDDWMGAIALLRAIPSQKHFSLLKFAQEMVRWLANQDDLFEALRQLTHQEQLGKKTIATVLYEFNVGALS